MTFTIEKDFSFSAAHRLDGLPEGHQCARVHGHNYVVRVRLAAGSVDATGFVLDYGLLAPFGRWLDDHLDHRDLNMVLPGLGGPSQPTAERMARWLAEVLVHVVDEVERRGLAVAVGISETPKTWAWAS